MGLNILLVRLLETKKDEYSTIPYFVTERIDWFDTGKCGGDRKFESHVYMLGKCKCEDDDTNTFSLDARCLWRIGDCTEWIREYITENCQKRLIDAIEYMQKNDNVYFDFWF